MDAVTEKTEAAENERLVLDMVDKFLEAEVRPHVRALEPDDIRLKPTDPGPKIWKLPGAPA